ncbi:MAG: VPLPA-CTERM-specific exosortase XrtD [Pseudomonadota bacterium]
MTISIDPYRDDANPSSSPGSGGLKEMLTGSGLFLASCLLAVLCFHEGMVALWVAWQVPEYSHGPLIPVISGYLFLRQLKTVAPNRGPVVDRWPGVVVMIAALLLGMLGNVTQIEKIVGLAIIIWAGGLVLVSFGWERGKQFWPPVLHLAFMLPLPFFLYWKTSIALQLISSEIGVAVIRLMEIPVFLDGNIIDLGTYKLHVAEACSGLRYLFPVMSFTYIFAVLYQGSYWHKGILLLSAIPIAILMNSLRVGIIGVLVDAYGIEMAEGFMHYFQGWAVFICCILLMIGLARVLQRLAGDRRTLAQVLDVDTSGLGPQMARVRDIRPSRALLGCLAAFAVAGALWSPLSQPEAREIQRDPFILFPNQLGEWNSHARHELPADITAALRADDYLSAAYFREGARAPVDLFVAWYKNQSTADGIHSPEVCIPAGGWEMSEIEVTAIPLTVEGLQMSVPVNRAIIQKGLSRQLVYYWFDQSGRRMTSDYLAKLYVLWDALETGRTDGALVRLVTPIGPSEPVENADARLQDLMAETLPVLDGFIGSRDPD